MKVTWERKVAILEKFIDILHSHIIKRDKLIEEFLEKDIIANEKLRDKLNELLKLDKEKK